MTAQDDIFIAGLCLREQTIPVTARPRPTSWWTVAETGKKFRDAARQAHRRIATDPRGQKLPDRDSYARAR